MGVWRYIIDTSNIQDIKVRVHMDSKSVHSDFM